MLEGVNRGEVQFAPAGENALAALDGAQVYTVAGVACDAPTAIERP